MTYGRLHEPHAIQVFDLASCSEGSVDPIYRYVYITSQRTLQEMVDFSLD